MSTKIITKKEKRDKPLSVRLPMSTVSKLKEISNFYERSQSEIIEALVNNYWLDLPKSIGKMETHTYEKEKPTQNT